MYLFETAEGDKWVCVNCVQEKEQEILQKRWEFIFEKNEPELRCGICGHGDFDFED